MNLLTTVLCLCLALVACHQKRATDPDEKDPDRCEGLEMDAVTVDEDDVPFFFKGDLLFKGFHGQAELSNGSYEELDNVHTLDHVDAAFIMHFQKSAENYDHIYFFLNDMVFRYFHEKLVADYPKSISSEFPGIPDNLDAVVECPEPDCVADTIIFFKGDDVYYFNVETKAVEVKDWAALPNCTSAFRFLGQHYCFFGTQFVQFDPKTGAVDGRWPKDARDYFMRCPAFGEGSVHVDRERCSHVHLDAVTSDDAKNVYFFRGHYFLNNEKVKGTFSAGTIETEFKEVHSNMDAAFAFQGHLYMAKGDQVFAYKSGEPNTLVEGYPKTVKEVLGLDGSIDAAYVCPGDEVAHIFQGQTVYEVNMTSPVLPREAVLDGPMVLFKNVDAAMCGEGGIDLIKGNHFYHFDSSKLMFLSRALPDQQRVSRVLLECDH